MKIKKISVILILMLDAVLIMMAVINITKIAGKADLPFEFNSENVILEGKFRDYQITSFEGVKPGNSKEIEYLCDLKDIGDTVILNLSSEEKEFSVRIRLVNYYSDFYLAVIIFVSLFFFIPAIYILIKNQDKKFSHIFHWLLVSAALMINLTWGDIDQNSLIIDLFIRTLFIASLLFTPVLLIHFSFHVPNFKWAGLKKLIIPLYSYCISVFLILSVLTYRYLTTGNIDDFSVFSSLNTYLAEIFFIPCGIFAIGNFVHSYLVSSSEADRQKLLWIFLGFSFGPFVYIFLYMIPVMILGHRLIPEAVMILSLSIAPITFFIAITSHRFADVNIIISKSAVFATIVGLIMIIYFAFIWASTAFIAEIRKEYVPLIVLATAIISVLLFQPVKNKIQSLIDTKLFKIREILRREGIIFSQQIKDCFTIEEIAALVIKTVQSAIPANKAGFVIFDDDGNIEYMLDPYQGFSEIEKEVLVEIPSQGNYSLIADKRALEEKLDYQTNDKLLGKIGAELLLLHCDNKIKPVNMLVLGEKRNYILYSEEDINFLRKINDEASRNIERIQIQQKLFMHKAETKRLKELNELKSFFVSSVSHELKTPLTSIKLFAELICNKENLKHDKLNEYSGIIINECGRLDNLINNVLNFSKIEKRTETYNFEEMDLKETLLYVSKTLENQLNAQNFDFKIEIDDNDYSIAGDSEALSEVFINVISNSIKYSLNEKYIKIKMYEKEQHFCVEIRDKGIGIDQSEQDKIFDSFYRSNSKSAQSIGGTGIGLSIVKNIISAHGGYIDLVSSPGKGSTFFLYFLRNNNHEKDPDSRGRSFNPAGT